MYLLRIIFLLVATKISINLALDDIRDHSENTRKVQLYFQDSQNGESDSRYKKSENNYRNSRDRKIGYTEYQFKQDSHNKQIDSIYNAFHNDHKEQENSNRNTAKEKSYILEPKYDTNTGKYSHASEHDHDHDEISHNIEQNYKNSNNKEPKTGYIKYKLERKEPKKEQISVKVIKEEKKTVVADRNVVSDYIKTETDFKESESTKEKYDKAYQNYEAKELKPREKNIFVNVVKEDKQTFLLKPKNKKEENTNQQKDHGPSNDDEKPEQVYRSKESAYKNHDTVKEPNEKKIFVDVVEEKKEITANQKHKESNYYYEQKPAQKTDNRVLVKVVKENNDKDDEDEEQNKRSEHEYKLKSSQSYDSGKDRHENNILVKIVKEGKKSFQSDSEHKQINPNYQSKYRITETEYKHSPDSEDKELEGPYKRYNVKVNSPKKENIFVNIVKEDKKKVVTDSKYEKDIHYEPEHSRSENKFVDSEREYKYSEDSHHEYEDTKHIHQSEHHISDFEHEKDHEHEEKFVHEYKSRHENEHDQENYHDDNENKKYTSEHKTYTVQNKDPKEKTIFVKVVKPKPESDNKYADRKHDVVVKIWTKKSK